MQTYEAALKEAIGRLRDAGDESANLDAGILLSYATGQDRLTLYTYPQREMSYKEYSTFDGLLRRREVGEPIAYILGEKEFYSRAFAVEKGVLIPRPDTETLIEVFKEFYPDNNLPLQMGEVGLGSGAIAITLLCLYPKAQLSGSDISEKARLVSTKNAQRHQVQDRLTITDKPWLEGLPSNLDVLVSNPPYIPHEEMATLSRDVRNFEPYEALEAGDDGLHAYNALIPQAAAKVKKGGRILLEVGYNQAQDVINILREQEKWQDIQTHKDLAGIERVVSARHT